MSGCHYQVNCSGCNKVIRQCRCPSKSKPTSTEVCTACKDDAARARQTEMQALNAKICDQGLCIHEEHQK